MSTNQGTAPAATPETSVPQLRARLDDVLLRDRRRLERRIDALRRTRDPKRHRSELARVASDVDTAVARALERRASVPVISYPDLPVSAARDDIAAAIRDSQVVVVAGETGSGKTTQLPKICLELGRGVRGLIGHTQPRRIAARSVAERIAEELDTPLGDLVGYTVRFTDQVSDSTLVKVMTDGILLAEIQRDRMLSAYDTIILDEAHERSLTIDFLLGYLKQLLPRRPDLKLIITSATIDPQRFSRHFDDAPILEVSGRTFPVEVRYRPLVEDAVLDDLDDQVVESQPRDQVQAVCDAVVELAAEGPGDVLVFLSGEREIRDTADALRGLVTDTRSLRGTEILPLYARLSAAEQHRVFEAHSGRRVVLATNVAETSLTVPGIRYVVDPGTARISRYSTRTKVQRLPIEAISQASARQRAGRCGRVAEGICIRLYSEDDYLARPEYTDPEILRTNLASVLLQMTALGLGDVEAFPFVDPPDRRAVKDGIDLLVELGALDPAQSDPRKRLTALGRRLAQIPLDPRLARMILAADEHGCTREVMVIAAALSIQDPRERPVEHQQAADERHARFRDPTSDFLSYLTLWNHIREQQRELSSSAFRRMCRGGVPQLPADPRVAGSGRAAAPAGPLDRRHGRARARRRRGSPRGAHRAAQRLLSHIGLKDAERNDYLGARGARFAVFPGSALFKKPPTWVMAAELVETSRLWGRQCARIEPEWVEPLAAHLVKRTYSEPHWEARRGAVVASERVTLYGVPIVAGRSVQYGRIDPELSRELFIRHALVEGDWRTPHRFFAANRALLEDVEDLENRVRRRDILVDDETLFAFYDARIPPDVVSGRHFDSWWKKARREDPELLTFTPEMLVSEAAGDVAESDYPDEWHQGDLTLPLTYQFEPGTAADGVTVHVPLVVLNRLQPEGFDWQIPGLRLELVTELIRSLPKHLRRLLVPAPDHARIALDRLAPPGPEGPGSTGSTGEPLLAALERELGRMAGTPIPRDAWQLDRVPTHLRVTFRIEDEKGQVLAEGKDLDALKHRLKPRQRATIARVAASIERSGLRAWPAFLPDGVLPRTFGEEYDGATVRGFPPWSTRAPRSPSGCCPQRPSRRGRIASAPGGCSCCSCRPPARAVLDRLSAQEKLALASAPHPNASALFDDCMACAVDALAEAAGGPVWDAAGFDRLLAAVKRGLEPEVSAVVGTVAQILTVRMDVDRRIRGTSSLVLLPALADLRGQLEGLVHPGFVAGAGRSRLVDVLRYLRGMAVRLDALPERPERDRQLMWRVELAQQSYDDALATLPPGRPMPAGLAEIPWMIEELRLSFFAQSIGTRYPVSEKRLQKALQQALHQAL
jgi:ATP-dependent helicase HrpA